MATRIPKRRDPKVGPSDSSDTAADRPGAADTDTDAGGTGERSTLGEASAPVHSEASTDRVVGPEEAGLGGGLDQAEEARRGKTDEQLKKSRR